MIVKENRLDSLAEKHEAFDIQSQSKTNKLREEFIANESVILEALRELEHKKKKLCQEEDKYFEVM